jgi:hypothetical protein
MKDVYSILRRKFPENEYSLMKEVSDAAGFSRSRSADYIAVNLYPSRGLAINGIELKSFRGDWLNELKNPKKAENIFQYCDYFWLLTTDESIAKIEEIPVAWGWMNIKGERVYIKKQAPLLEPKPVSKGFMCAMLKRASSKEQFVHISAIEDKIEEARRKGLDENQRLITHLQNQVKEHKELVKSIEESSGIDLNSWHINREPKKIGEIIKLIESGGADKLKQDLINLKESADKTLQKINEGIELLNK